MNRRFGEATLLMLRALVIVLLMVGAQPATAEEYPTRITPHPDLGKFKPPRDPDRPITAFYGGIGLRDLGGGQWTGYGITDRADVDRLIQRCREFGMNRIYASLLEQWPPSRYLRQPAPGAKDLIPYAVEQAHANGIQVYADLPIFCNSELDQPFWEQNPDLVTYSESGEKDPHMFSPAYPKVRAYKRAILLEWLSRYPVDGVQLDFIRWPYYGNDSLHGYCAHGYDEPLLRELRRRHDLPDDFRPRPDDPRFVQIRSDYVALFIRELRDALRLNGIELPIGVYNSNTYGRVPSLHDVCQDWEYWENNRLVDEHHPMFVLDSITRLVRATRSLMDVKRPGSIVFGPIFLAEGFRPSDGFAPTADMCRDAARRLIKLGCDGIWFCRAGEIEEFKLWPVVREISRLSLRDIRAQDFDPLYENLVPNGGFEAGMESWQADPDDGARIVDEQPACGKSCLRLTLQPQHAVRVSLRSPIRFSPHVAYAVRSLGLAFRYRAVDFKADTPVQVTLRLRLTNDTVEEKVFAPASENGQWRLTKSEFRVARDAKKVVKAVELEIRVPPGSGTVWLDEFEMIFDPLDNLPAETSQEVRGLHENK